nr:unnamed protein product [Naegleria fowleri]
MSVVVAVRVKTQDENIYQFNTIKEVETTPSTRYDQVKIFGKNGEELIELKDTKNSVERQNETSSSSLTQIKDERSPPPPTNSNPLNISIPSTSTDVSTINDDHHHYMESTFECESPNHQHQQSSHNTMTTTNRSIISAGSSSNNNTTARPPSMIQLLNSSQSFTPRSSSSNKSNENILFLAFEMVASTSFLIYLIYGVFYYSFHSFAIPLLDNSAHHYLLPSFFLLGGVCVSVLVLSGFFLWKVKKLRSVKKYKLNKCVSCSVWCSFCGLLVCLIPLVIALICTVIYIGLTIANTRSMSNIIGCVFYGVICVIALAVTIASSIGCALSMKKIKKRKRNIPLLLFRKFRQAIAMMCVVISVILFFVMFIYLMICGAIFSNLQLSLLSTGIEFSVFTRVLYFLEWMTFFACVAFGIIFFKQFPKITLLLILLPLLLSVLSFALSIVENNMMYNHVMDGAFRNLYGVFGDNNYILDQAVTLMAMIFFNVTCYFAYFKIKL